MAFLASLVLDMPAPSTFTTICVTYFSRAMFFLNTIPYFVYFTISLGVMFFYRLHKIQSFWPSPPPEHVNYEIFGAHGPKPRNLRAFACWVSNFASWASYFARWFSKFLGAPGPKPRNLRACGRQVPDFGHQVPDFARQVPDFGCQVPDFRPQMPILVHLHSL